MSRAPLQNADEAKATMSVHDSSARVDIERELEGRMLLNEQRRSAVLACILAAIVVGRGVYHLAYGFAAGEMLGRRDILLVDTALVGLETHHLILGGRRIRERRGPVKSRAYLRTAFEVAMPTVMLAIM